ncbi:uncharacterized protein LDX57_001913 [Aspergillus melleus]|uniref:uncharacterized protein n=1 Tax=Aspergillus melleus TaxID=138277 RepID=UPI001E8CD707|nr:uncharacterized protein LDX57_001913 [Aspergillus melleus]KAH8424158.1 hypothetical protein LDX57_001913 [Aspergillus melleus]
MMGKEQEKLALRNSKISFLTPRPPTPMAQNTGPTDDTHQTRSPTAASTATGADTDVMQVLVVHRHVGFRVRVFPREAEGGVIVTDFHIDYSDVVDGERCWCWKVAG